MKLTNRLILTALAIALLLPLAAGCNRDEVIESDGTTPLPLGNAHCNRVYDYTPAPGQFIGDLTTSGFDGSEATHQDAIEYATRRLSERLVVSLGGFGGYIVVGFDHNIYRTEQGGEIAIVGNAFEHSSEPGIVWVMQDENGDSLPNDTWYELAGSEADKPSTIYNYSVTYYRPTGAAQPVAWTDNMGGSGQIDYLKSFHPQDSYYPTWIQADSYTLTGTRIEARNYDSTGDGAKWVQPPYDWGYADNYSSVDRLQGTQTNLLSLCNARDAQGQSVELEYINFVKVQTACNTKSGWVGEQSTEIIDIYHNSPLYE